MGDPDACIGGGGYASNSRTIIRGGGIMSNGSVCGIGTARSLVVGSGELGGPCLPIGAFSSGSTKGSNVKFVSTSTSFRTKY